MKRAGLVMASLVLMLPLTGCVLEGTITALNCLAGNMSACTTLEGLSDYDEDGVASERDNCPTYNNTDQADLDGDRIGDRCDDDEDGDGVPNTSFHPDLPADPCPRVAGPSTGENPGCPGEDPPPGAPTGLTADAFNDRTVFLEWRPNRERDVREYGIYRSTTPGGGYSRIATVEHFPGFDGSYHDRDPGLANFTTYYYVVDAVDDAGQRSGFSSEARARTCSPPEDFPSGCPPPSPDSGGRAVPSMKVSLSLGLARRAPNQGLRASVSGSIITLGRVTRPNGLFVGKNATAAGTFKGQMTSGRRRSPGSGTWRSRFDLRIDPRAHTGSAKGFLLLTFKSRRQGELCISFRTTYALKGSRLSARGTYRTRGGTGSSRKLRARGSYRNDRVREGTLNLRGTGHSTRGRSKGLPRACRDLKRAP